MSKDSVREHGWAWVTHYAVWLTGVGIVVASVATAVRADGLVFRVIGAVGWALSVVLLVAAGELHEWEVCPLCAGPPAVVATPEARARLAGRVHGRRGRVWEQLLWVGAFWVAPNLGGSPALCVVAAVVWVAAAGRLAQRMLARMRHLHHNDECRNPKCRVSRVESADRWRLSVSHHGLWALLLLIPGVCGLGVWGLTHPVLDACYTVAVAVLGLMLWMVAAHAGAVCVLCTAQVSSGGGVFADRHRLWLRVFHTFGSYLPPLAGAVWVVSWITAGSLTARLCVAVAAGVMTGWLALARVHGRAGSWCPWCRDDEDDDSDAETPDPVPGRSVLIPS